jgi:CBS domain containing-hemolysin-like protein
MGSITTIIVLGILLILSGFFSSTETAFSSMNVIRIKQFAKSTKKKVSRKAKLALKLQENYAILISTILVGNNIVNLTSASLATYLFSTVFKMGESGVFVATVVMTVMVIIFGEIVPKTLARVWPEKLAMFASLPINVLVVILKPVTLLFGKFDEKMSDMVDEEEKVTATEDELIDIVEKIEKEGVLEHQESELIQSAITFDSKSVRNVMTPKEAVKYVNIDDSFERVANFFQYYQYSRAPVYDAKKDLIVGVINQKDVYSCYVKKEKKNASELMGDAIYVSHRRLIPYALEIVQKNKSHLAIVVDNIKDKHFLGVITLEDILEELVGEIYDEYDDTPANVFEIGNHLYQVNGRVTLNDLFDNYLTETDFPHTKGKNVREWIKEKVGNVRPNVELYYDNLHITILEVNDDKVELVEIEILTDYDGE